MVSEFTKSQNNRKMVHRFLLRLSVRDTKFSKYTVIVCCAALSEVGFRKDVARTNLCHSRLLCASPCHFQCRNQRQRREIKLRSALSRCADTCESLDRWRPPCSSSSSFYFNCSVTWSSAAGTWPSVTQALRCGLDSRSRRLSMSRTRRFAVCFLVSTQMWT